LVWDQDAGGSSPLTSTITKDTQQSVFYYAIKERTWTRRSARPSESERRVRKNSPADCWKVGRNR